jgi:hypothetical protein
LVIDPATRPVGKQTFGARMGQALFSTDLDNTVVAWQDKDANGIPKGLMETVQFLHRRARSLTVMANTGRGLSSLQRAWEQLGQKAPAVWQRWVIDALALGNGQTIFWNRERLPAAQWIPTLTMADQDLTWQQLHTTMTGWQLSPFLARMQAAFATHGYTSLPAGSVPGLPGKLTWARPVDASGSQRFILQADPDQASIRIRLDSPTAPENEEALLRKEAEALTRRIVRPLRAAGWGIHINRTAYPLTYLPGPHWGRTEVMFSYGPQGITKASAAQYVADELPRQISGRSQPVRALMTAGDDVYNDKELLTARYRQAPDGRLPLYPVMVGDQATLWQAVSKVPQAIQVPLGKLAEGLAAQWQRIQPQLKAAGSANPT